jgi:hypothetical protein
MKRSTIVLFAAPLGLAAVGAFFGFRIHAELARGQQVFWLAELWPPAAVFSVMVVVCIDLLVPASPPAQGAPKEKVRHRSAA